MTAERKFNIGVSRKLLNPDMSAVITEIDFDLLLNNPQVDLSTLPDVCLLYTSDAADE